MTTQARFYRLFQTGFIGKMEIRNRIVMPPMATNFGTTDGKVTDLLIDHYEQRAQGGTGLIIVEGTCVDYPRGKGWINEIGIDDDKYIPGLKRLTNTVHKHGAKVALQLHHAGREAKQRFTGIQPICPSSSQTPWGDRPKEMTTLDIKESVRYFAMAAVRAKQSGFDGIEIHAAHGYLFAQFLSPFVNKRRDEYGGELINRARFLCEVIKAVKHAVGDDYPVWCRLNGKEANVDGGVNPWEMKQVAKMVQEAGCDALHISAFGFGEESNIMFPEQAGGLVWLAEGVKKAVNIPVIAVGSIIPEVAERVLEEGRADFIAMGRELLCDPALPKKIAQDKIKDIIPCIHCLNCVDRVVFKDEKVTCTVNPTLSREPGFSIKPAARSKRVLVIGGGPAGLEAARVAALRGHEVTLYEQEPELGGQMLLACVPPHKEKIRDYLNYLKVQVYKMNIKVETGKRVTIELVQQLKADTAIVATGPLPTIPTIPGLNNMKPVLAQEVLRDNAEVGNRIAIVGGGIVGCETAEFLADKGKKITIIEVLSRLAVDMIPLRRIILLSRLQGKGVRMLTGMTCVQVSVDGIVVATKEGQRETIPADTIVIAAGSRPNMDLYRDLEGIINKVHLIGDAAKPRTILEAISEGYNIGIAS